MYRHRTWDEDEQQQGEVLGSYQHFKGRVRSCVPAFSCRLDPESGGSTVHPDDNDLVPGNQGHQEARPVSGEQCLLFLGALSFCLLSCKGLMHGKCTPHLSRGRKVTFQVSNILGSHQYMQIATASKEEDGIQTPLIHTGRPNPRQSHKEPHEFTE